MRICKQERPRAASTNKLTELRLHAIACSKSTALSSHPELLLAKSTNRPLPMHVKRCTRKSGYYAVPQCRSFSFSHPDYTVGPGFTPGPPCQCHTSYCPHELISPGHGLTKASAYAVARSLAALSITAGWESHPAPKESCNLI